MQISQKKIIPLVSRIIEGEGEDLSAFAGMKKLRSRRICRREKRFMSKKRRGV